MSERDPELERLLAPLRDGPIALRGADQSEQHRERALGALRAQVRQVPRWRRRRRLVRRTLGGGMAIVASGLLWLLVSWRGADVEGAQLRTDGSVLLQPQEVAARSPVERSSPKESRSASKEPRATPGPAPVGTASPEPLPRSVVDRPVERSGAVERTREVLGTERVEPARKGRGRGRHHRATRSGAHARERGESGTLEAENRLMASALRAERAREPERARALFVRLLRTYPRSPLVPEAKAGIARLRE